MMFTCGISNTNKNDVIPTSICLGIQCTYSPFVNTLQKIFTNLGVIIIIIIILKDRGEAQTNQKMGMFVVQS